MLEAIFGKYFGLAKLIGIGIALLAAAGLLTWAVVTVDGWRHDSKMLPQVTAERDTAIAAKAELEKYAVGAFTHIAGGIDALGAKWANFETGYAGSMAAIDTAVANFKGNTAHVEACPLPGSTDDLAVRGGLLNLLANPDTGAIERVGDGAGDGGTKAGVPGAAAPTAPLPRQKAGGKDGQGVVVSGTGRAGRRRQAGAAEGRRGAGNRLGAKGTDGTVRVGRVGPAVPEPAFHIHVTAKSATIRRKVMKIVNAALESAGYTANPNNG